MPSEPTESPLPITTPARRHMPQPQPHSSHPASSPPLDGVARVPYGPRLTAVDYLALRPSPPPPKRRAEPPTPTPAAAAAARRRADASSIDDRKKQRAERNRVSAMKSRERIGRKESALERHVHHGRITGQRLKRAALTYRSYLRQALDAVARAHGKSQAKVLAPRTAAALEHIDKTIADCVWSFRPIDTPLVSLKYKPVDNVA